MFGRPFLQTSAAERQKFMERISRNEKNPKENVEISFATIKWWVAEAYYTSKTGIHDELKYPSLQALRVGISRDIGDSRAWFGAQAPAR